MSDVARRVKALVEGLVHSRQHYVTLKTLLEEQRQHIVARRTGALDAVNTQIMALYQSLNQSNHQRQRLLRELGMQSSAHGMQTLINRLGDPHRQRVNALWKALLQLASDCRSANEYNGTLMHMQQDILANILNTSEPENWLYQEGA